MALAVDDLMPAVIDDADPVRIWWSRSDGKGQGATAFLCPRALCAWRSAARLWRGPLFKQVLLRRMPAQPTVRGERWARSDGGELRHGRYPDQPAVPAHTRFTADKEPCAR